MASRAKHPWDRIEYQQIASAAYRDGDIVVVFADGGEAQVSASRLVSEDGPEPDWTHLRAENFHLVVPSPVGDIEVPWDVIRVHSDPAFDTFWQEFVASSVAAHSPSRTG
jgi:hypothetical protein